MTPLPDYRGKTQFQVQRETLEFAASLCEQMARNAAKSGLVPQQDCASNLALNIRAHIPSVVEINHG
jgi:hypothetical protein